MERCMKMYTRDADADDVEVITEINKELQEALTKCNMTMKRMRMKMNKQETEIMEISKVKAECNIYSEHISDAD